MGLKKSIFTEKIQRIYRIQVLPQTPEELESMAVKTSVKLLCDKVSAFLGLKWELVPSIYSAAFHSDLI